MDGSTKQKNAHAQLIEKIKVGDEASWDMFLEKFDDLICSVTAWPKWHFDEHARKDVAQRIRSDLLQSIPAFRGESSLEYYIKTISIRQCIAEVNRQVRQRERFVSTVVLDESGNQREMDLPTKERDDPVHLVVLAERAQALKRLLAMMDETCRAMITKFYIEGIPYKHLATEYGIAINTVGSRLARCMEKLRKLTRNDAELAEDFPG